MSRAAPNDEEAQVHVLHVGGPSRRRRLPVLLGVLALAAVAAAGAWLWLDPSRLAALAGRPAAAAAPHAAGNLLEEDWSFETTESGSASRAWRVPEEAPAGFEFTRAAAVSGELGARAAAAPNGEEDGLEANGADGGDAGAGGAHAGRTIGFRRMVGERAVPLGAHRGAVSISAVSAADGVQLFLRFEAPGRRPLDLVVASGAGAIEGRALAPPGTTSVRAGIGCVGPGSLDDVSLRFVAEPAEGLEGLRDRGVFDVLPAGDGLLVFRGDELSLRVHGLEARAPGGALLPPGAGWLPGASTLVLADGTRCERRVALEEDARRMRLDETLASLPPGARLVRTAVVGGSLASEPLGVVSARGLESFTGDFRIEGALGLAFGRTQDRLALELGGPCEVTGAWQPDGTVLLRAEAPAEDGARGSVSLQTSFQEERVAAAQHRDAALAAERGGRLGQALIEAGVIVTRFPHDAEVTAEAQALRARVESVLRARLERIDAALDDALFLQSAARCREALRDCEEAARQFAGSEAEAVFRERADVVARGAAALLEEDRSRRARRVQALRDSFAEAGGFPSVVAELDEAFARHLAPAAAADAPPEGSP